MVFYHYEKTCDADMRDGRSWGMLNTSVQNYVCFIGIKLKLGVYMDHHGE